MEQRSNEFRTGWRVVFAGLVGNALSAATLSFYTIGVFGPAMAMEFHWSVGQVTSGLLVNTIVVLFTSPLAGTLSDRFGVRRVVLCSTLLLAPAYMMFALNDGSILRYYLIWALVGILGGGTLPPTWSRSINNRFQKYKGLALGLSLVGTGIAAALLKPFSFGLIADWGWRGGYIGLGCLPLISFLVAAIFFFDVPRDAREAAAADKERVAVAASGVSLAGAVREWRFWVLFVAVGAAALGVGGPIPSLESVLREIAFPREQIITLASIVGISVMIGRLGSSYLIDRIWAPLVAFVMFVFASAAIFALSWGQPAFGLTAVILFFLGCATGMEVDMAPFLVARYFGGRSYSGIYGAIYGMFAICTGLGAMLFGVAHDRMGSFGAVLPIFAAAVLAGGVMLLTLGRYAYPAGSDVRRS